MRASAALLCLGFLCLGFVCIESVPIPPRYGGFALGSGDAPVVIEMWGDFQCMDCRMAWPVVRQVMQYFGPKSVKVILHAFPLTMHRQAWDVTQAAAIVSQHTQPAALFSFFDFLWDHQPEFNQATFYSKTQSDLYALLATYVAGQGVSNTTFYQKMGSNEIFNIAYLGVQMGADRHVYGTPTFYINGIRSDFDETTTYATWVNFIKSLLNQS